MTTSSLPSFNQYLGSGTTSTASGSAFPGSGTPSATSILASLFGTGTGTAIPIGTSGFSKSDQTRTVWVPSTPGTTQGIHTASVAEYLSEMAADPADLQAWVPLLEQTNFLTPNPGAAGTYDPMTILTSLAKALVLASQQTGPTNKYGTNLTDYLNTTAASQATQPGGTQRFFKGTTTEVTLTGPGAVQVEGNQVAQQLIGRRLTGAQVDAITSILNNQEIKEGTIRSLAAQAQQAGLYEAYQGGSETAAGAPEAGGATISMGSTGKSAMSALPTWQGGALQKLAQSGQLSGVDPNVLAAIVVAESSGQGGSINSEGYGGFFGLGASSSYPAGNSSASLLHGTDESSFSQQAVLAASDFAALLKQFNGNIYLAETAYQTGPNSAQVKAGQAGGEGVNVMKRYGIPETVAAPPGSQSGGITGSGTFVNSSGQPVQQGPPTPGGSASANTPTAPAPQPPQSIAPNTPTGITALPQGATIPNQPGTYQMGNATSFQTPTGTDYVLPPQAAVVQAPETASEAAATYLMNNDSVQFQAQNLMNTFSVIDQMLKGAASNKQSPLNKAVTTA